MPTLFVVYTPAMSTDRNFERSVLERLPGFKPSKADVRRVEILNAVIACIAEEGVQNLNSLSISKRAKMRRSHVAYYFSSQEKMIDAAVKYVVALSQEIVVAQLHEHRDPSSLLGAYVDATYSWLSRFPQHGAVMSLLQYLAGISPGYHGLMTQVQKASEDRIAGMLLYGSVNDGARRKAALKTAHEIRNYLVGALISFSGSGNPDDFDRHRQMVKARILSMAKPPTPQKTKRAPGYPKAKPTSLLHS